MKSVIWEEIEEAKESLPVRGAWIEMTRCGCFRVLQSRRSPCGERGLKSVRCARARREGRVAPRAGSVD